MNSPVQVPCLPVKPGLHKHKYPPNVSLHRELLPQVCLPKAHSSTSKVREKTNKDADNAISEAIFKIGVE